MRTRMSRIAFVSVLLELLIAFQAQAETVIYQDTFTATDGATLAGHTPDTTSGGASWTGAGYIVGGKADNGGGYAYLPFNAIAGKIYSLSFEMAAAPTVSTPNGSWIAFGYAATGGDLWNTGYGITLVTDQGKVYKGDGPGLFGGDGLSNVTNVTAGTTHKYSVVLDTTASAWKADWYLDTNTSPWYSYSFTSATPTIGTIAILFNMDNAQNPAGYTFDNLSLSAVPEPSALILLGTSLFGLLAYAWRKHRI